MYQTNLENQIRHI